MSAIYKFLDGAVIEEINGNYYYIDKWKNVLVDINFLYTIKDKFDTILDYERIEQRLIANAFNSFALPQGYTVASSWGGWDVYSPTGTLVEPEPAKCECGTTKTMGKDDHPQFHSDWCSVYKEYKAKEQK